jgi:hypothetical protein
MTAPLCAAFWKASEIKGVSSPGFSRRFDSLWRAETKGSVKKSRMTACFYENMLTWKHETMKF